MQEEKLPFNSLKSIGATASIGAIGDIIENLGVSV